MALIQFLRSWSSELMMNRTTEEARWKDLLGAFRPIASSGMSLREATLPANAKVNLLGPLQGLHAARKGMRPRSS